MQLVLSDPQRRLLRMTFERGAHAASRALSKWLGQEVHLAVSEVELVELTEVADLLGPADSLVAACTMGLTGQLSGLLLLIFEDSSGLALVDLLLGQPLGTTNVWSALEISAAKETTNIVGCAYLNELATHLPTRLSIEGREKSSSRTGGTELVPTPPTFVHEFAGSLLQFALMDQVGELDEVMLIHSRFGTAQSALNLQWTLLFIPGRTSLHDLLEALR
jgi:chemotaxis protein CheC